MKIRVIMYGFMAIDEIAIKLEINVEKNKFKALIGEKIYKGEKIILVKPQTYMNLSGESVRELLDFYKISMENLIIIYDDIDLPFGSIRIKKSGGPGTHNGMRNIIQCINSENFARIRIGTGKPENNEIDLADFVLKNLTKEEKNILDKSIKIVYSSIEELLESNIDTAMNLYNNKNGV